MTSPDPVDDPSPPPAPAPHGRVATIPPYHPGRSAEEIMAEHGVGSAVKLASNEAPFGPLPGVIDAVVAATAGSGRYPDHLAETLRDALAARHGVRPERIAVGCGSVGLLQQILLAFAGPGDEVLFPWPSFIAYPQFTMLAGARIVETPLAEWTIDVDALLDAATPRTTLALIANPNNPTSTALRTDALVRLVEGLPPRVLIVIDEAYREYVTDPDVPDALELFRDRPNVVVLRTFSKAWGLAGLRVGYLVGHPSVPRAVDVTLTPFSVSAPAQAAALAAMQQPEEVARRARLVVEERDRVRAELALRGLPVPESQANFVWLPSGPASSQLADAMERKGVVTRAFPTGIRVTIGLPGEDERFLAALEDALAEVPAAHEAWTAAALAAARGTVMAETTRLPDPSDPTLTSWVPVPEGSDFPIQNLPFGVVRPPRGLPRPVVRIGDHVVDLPALAAAGQLDVPAPAIFHHSSLNPLMASGLGPSIRRQLSALLSGPPDDVTETTLLPLDEVEVELPVAVGDYVDFYSSLHHASNLGRMMRPDAEPILPNWRHLPVGYHGRAGTIVVSGTDVARPEGLIPGDDGVPRLAPSRALDIELEVGFVVGRPGTRIRPDDADRHVFGVVLLNDWSARDVQAFESQPLGPNLAKSFATTISPWVVTLDALRPYLVPAPPQDPTPDPYLQTQRPWALDLDLEVWLNGERITATTFRDMYWTFAQQLAHVTVNGATTSTGDLFGSGTVSGPTKGERGSLIEITWRGAEPLTLADGSNRSFLLDGDTVSLRGWCGGDAPDRPRIGFGEAVGSIVAAPRR